MSFHLELILATRTKTKNGNVAFLGPGKTPVWQTPGLRTLDWGSAHAVALGGVARPSYAEINEPANDDAIYETIEIGLLNGGSAGKATAIPAISIAATINRLAKLKITPPIKADIKADVEAC